MTPHEERVVATHEAGHTVCTLFTEHGTPIERVSIRGDMSGALGYVEHQDPAHRYVVTRLQLLDDLCRLMGGREAEQLLLNDQSIGCWEDLRRATQVARLLVEELGMGGPEVGVSHFHRDDGQRGRHPHGDAGRGARRDADLRRSDRENVERRHHHEGGCAGILHEPHEPGVAPHRRTREPVDRKRRRVDDVAPGVDLE